MRYFNVHLKVYKKEKVFDPFDKVYIDKNVKKNIVNFDIDHPFSKAREYISWRKSIWDIGYIRSLEIWKELPKKSLENGVGQLTDEAKKSLSGKLGLYNGKTCKKDENGNWKFLKFNVRQAVFNLLSDKAIITCKERARSIKPKSLNK